MARQGLPRLRHLKHRIQERVKRQPLITDFVAERIANSGAYRFDNEVWDALKIRKPRDIVQDV